MVNIFLISLYIIFKNFFKNILTGIIILYIMKNILYT